MKQINTVTALLDFINRIEEQKKSVYKRSLEEYLQALWAVVNKYRDEKVTGDLLAQVIAEAFEIEPPEFDEQWLEYKNVYFGWEKDDSGYAPLGYNNKAGEAYIVKRGVSDFELFRDVILCQIADLYRMKDTPPPKVTISYQSPTGIYWGIYPSPGVFFHLYSGVSKMFELNPYGQLVNFDWADLAILLQFARNAIE